MYTDDKKTVPRMRTIHKSAEAIRKADPETAFTERALRRLVINGDVPSVRVGAKYLVNLDRLLEQLSDGLSAADKPAEPADGIRKIAV